ncbi:hypothetical protein KFU94_35610 [Chloroflexi bacterium TSY]|nr:hypothetical protein [Chloroflexi bacterium TSY]
MLNYLRYNYFLLIRTIILSIWHTEWGKTHQEKGSIGVAKEAIKASLAINSWCFFLSSQGTPSKAYVQHILESYGIKMWGWGYSHGEFFFRVRVGQSRFAQQLLLKHNIPIVGGLIDGVLAPQASRDAYSVDSSKTSVPETEAAYDQLDSFETSMPETEAAHNQAGKTNYVSIKGINKVADKISDMTQF